MIFFFFLVSGEPRSSRNSNINISFRNFSILPIMLISKILMIYDLIYLDFDYQYLVHDMINDFEKNAWNYLDIIFILINKDIEVFQISY